MSVFATYVSRSLWRISPLCRPLATRQRPYLFRALSSGSEGEKDGKNAANVLQSNFEEEHPHKHQAQRKGWKRGRGDGMRRIKAYPDVGERIPPQENQPRVNLSNLMDSLRARSEQPMSSSSGDENNVKISEKRQEGGDEQPNIDAEQKSGNGGDQELSVSAFSQLLNKSRGAVDAVTLFKDGRGASGDHSSTREESRATSTEKIPSAEDIREETREIENEDVKGTGRFGQPPQFEEDPELANRVKNILSELKVEASHKGLAKGIVGAVKNWGKSHPRHRDDLIQEYMSQEREFLDEGSAVGVDFTSGSRLSLFDAAFQKAAPKEAVPHKPFLMELDKGNRIQELVLSDARRNDFEDLVAISHRQWQFPVDNEVCKVDEADVGFEEHTFLQYLLDEFPEIGPVRRFMELVINGLEQNPHLTVKEKKDQVFWFKDYFSNFSEEELNF